MASFDVSKDWVILVPAAAKKAGEDLSRHIDLLRREQGLALKAPACADAAGDVPPEPLIVLNCETAGPPERRGFTWKAGRDRIEICGESGRGLCNGAYDFLSALGISWPEPGQEKLPPAAKNGDYPLGASGAYNPSSGKAAAGRAPRRLVFSREAGLKKPEKILAWAARNKIDILVLPFFDGGPLPSRILGINRRSRENFLALAEEYAFLIEIGGWELSRLAPRRYFFVNKELFRMEMGKRQREYNFCPTNHETIALLKAEAEKRFRAAGETAVFHLWPDRGQEQRWCACPSCRAFTPAEQNRIAVNAAADVLAAVNPEARISYYENSGEEGDIPLRPNLFRVEGISGPDWYII